jgi:membrane protease YdiL (CAAX protease family)
MGLAAMVGLRAVAERILTEEEKRSSILVHWAPRNAGDWSLASASGIAAGIAEEAAYRGVGLAILTPFFGSAGLTIVLLAAAFAAGHAVQGMKSGIIVFAMALLMHGLVAATGTLVIAMVAHAAYDVIAIWLLTRYVQRQTAELNIAAR